MLHRKANAATNLPVNLIPEDKSSKATATILFKDTAYIKNHIGCYYMEIETSKLPFTNTLRLAQRDVQQGCEETYVDIGQCSQEDRVFKLTPNDVLHFNYSLMAHVLRQGTARHVWRKGPPRYFASFFRERALSNNVPFAAKIIILQLIVEQVNPFKQLARCHAAFESAGLPTSFSSIYRLMWVSGLVVKIAALIRPGTRVLNVDVLLAEINSTLVESNIASLCSYKANTKLAFITRSQRFDPTYLADVLYDRARMAYASTVPFFDSTHGLNYARATLNSYAIRMINHYTQEGNARLINGENGGDNNRFVQLSSKFENYLPDTQYTEDALIDYLDDKGAYNV